MCAIAGMIGFDGALDKALYKGENAAEKMISVLKRRGPDGDGEYRRENALMVHTRLAVIDPENGAQPMIFKEGGRELALVYNGELYNTDEVRRELEAAGRAFKTNTDTEAVLLAFAEWGEDCVKHFNGIYAFAVWDEKERRLFAARDRIGVKPFFYTIKDGVFYFSSEIKGLLCHNAVEAKLTGDGIKEIMLLGPARSEGCGVLEGIEELRPAECAWFTSCGLKKLAYWDVSNGADKPFEESFDEVKEHISFLVRDSITRQTVSDVPLCTFLSGGLDSSIISAVTNESFKKSGRQLHTFSVEYRNNAKYFKAGKFQPNSDEEYVDIMSKFLGSVHHKIILDVDELVDALYTAAEARDMPGMADVDSSMLLLCKAIREQFTVALSGECADEIFGGYPWYRDKDIRMTDGFPWSQSTAYRARFIRKEHLKDKKEAEDFVYSKYLETISKVKEPTPNALEKRMREMMRLNMDWFMQTLLEANV